jgi:pimeloyl-ACP methyl ester carboxylesterase
MRGITIICYSLIMALICGNLYAHEQTVVKVKTRGDVNLKYLLIKPENPTASVILFAGGHGGLQLVSFFGKPGMKWGKSNFLVRTRALFADNGFVVAVFDSPSDHKKMSSAWRIGKEHVDDIKAVIDSLKQNFDLPIWVIGTSMGTFSAPNAAIRIQSGIDGIVLTSSITRTNKEFDIKSTHPNGIINMELDKITVPSLIVSHKEDECKLTPAVDSEKLKDALSNSTKVEVLYYSGGKKPLSGSCEPKSAHGFYGIEEQVVNDISDFIKDNSK